MFGRIFVVLVKTGGETEKIMIDTTHRTAGRMVTSLLTKGGAPPLFGRLTGGLNSILRAVWGNEVRPRPCF